MAVNVFICRKLFVTEYLDQMGSIEAAYIGLSRWIMEHPRELDWFPLWYGGIPFQNAYPPLLHLTVALAAAAFQISPALAHHLVGALMYSFGPVSLYWLASTLSGRRGLSLAAALFYSLVSPSAILVPVIAHDMGAFLGPRRLQTLVQYGEGPHIMSLTLLPVALVLLHRALSDRRPVPVYLAALALAAVVLTNWLGAFALAAAVAAYLLGYLDWRRPTPAIASGGTAILAYCLAAPWIPPSTLAAVRKNAQYTVGQYPMTGAQLVYGGLLLAGVVGLWLFLRRTRVSSFLIFAGVFSLVMAAIALTGHWFGIYMAPQPERYHLEMDMGLALVAVFAYGAIHRRLPPWPRRAVVVAAVLAAAVQLDEHAYHARKWLRPIEIGETVEYRSARWLQENLPGRRVFATGSIKFWLNAFADNPQLGGGFDQGIVNPVIPKITFGIPFTEGDGERCAIRMRAYGIDAAVVSGPQTRDAYHDYRDAAKFHGVLPELWREGDDAIYAVPRRSASLAHVIPRQVVVRREPYNLEDVDAILGYHAALEDPHLPAAQFVWHGTHEAAIEAVMDKDHVLSVQVSYHPGWRATVDGRRAPITADALGLMAIDPRCSGPCAVHLLYDGGTEMLLAKLARGIALIAGLLWFLRRRKR